MKTDYIKEINESRVYDVAEKTPISLLSKISEKYDNLIFLKREDLQPIFSFKCRGAYNKISSLEANQKAKGIIAASAGNHAQGVALSASKLDIDAVIVMPTTTPTIKINSVKKFGVQVLLYGDSFDEAYEKALKISKKDEKDRKIVYDFLPKKYHQYHYIGRLDYNSEGLLLFTKETSFKRYMELPKSNIKRSYLVNVIGSFDENKIKSMNKKIYGKEIYKKPNVNLVHSNGNKHVLRFDLSEGKNREIRNICTLFNLKVEKLKRISYGRFLLKSITYGNYKEMQVDESYKR